MNRVAPMEAAKGQRAPNPALVGEVLRDVFTAIVREAVRAELAESAPAPPSAAALVDREGLAKALGVSLASLDRMRKEAGFPELRVCDAPRFILADVLGHLRKAAAK